MTVDEIRDTITNLEVDINNKLNNGEHVNVGYIYQQLNRFIEGTGARNNILIISGPIELYVDIPGSVLIVRSAAFEVRLTGIIDKMKSYNKTLKRYVDRLSEYDRQYLKSYLEGQYDKN